MERESRAQFAIVEDDALVRAALEDCMESAGYQVASFTSAEDFLERGSAQTFDCLILDIELPGISGLELQSRLRQAGDHTPITFVTAHCTDAKRARATKLGAAGFLCKPVRRE